MAVSSLAGRWRRFLDVLWNPGLYLAVRRLAPRRFSEFGYRGLRAEYHGTQWVVELEHCEIAFYCYRADVGSAITPKTDCPGVSCATKIVHEESVHWRSVYAEVDRQMRLVIHGYEPVLQGYIVGWKAASELECPNIDQGERE